MIRIDRLAENTRTKDYEKQGGRGEDSLNVHV